MSLCGPYGPRLKAPTPRKSLKHPQRKRRRIGLIPLAKRGLKNAGKGAMPDRHAARGPCSIAVRPQLRSRVDGQLESAPVGQITLGRRFWDQADEPSRGLFHFVALR